MNFIEALKKYLSNSKNYEKSLIDGIKVTGKVHFQLYDCDGNLKQEVETPNTVTTLGKTNIAAILVGGTTRIAYCGLGTGTGANASNTTGTQWIVTCSSANATIAATYTNNGTTVTVAKTIASGTTLVVWAAAAWTPATGSPLVKSGGSGDPNITFSAATANITNLNIEIASSRTTLGTPTSSGAVATYTNTFAAGVATAAITEAGLCTAVTDYGSDVWCYQCFSVINKGSADSLVETWTLTFS